MRKSKKLLLVMLLLFSSIFVFAGCTLIGSIAGNREVRIEDGYIIVPFSATDYGDYSRNVVYVNGVEFYSFYTYQAVDEGLDSAGALLPARKVSLYGLPSGRHTINVVIYCEDGYIVFMSRNIIFYVSEHTYSEYYSEY